MIRHVLEALRPPAAVLVARRDGFEDRLLEGEERAPAASGEVHEPEALN